MPPAVPAPIQAGRVLGGRYHLMSPIARGGMAEVWQANDTVLARPVAVKVLQAHLAHEADFIERFRREAVTAARLTHPNIVATYDTGSDDGTSYIVMELIRGQTLRQLLGTRGALPPTIAVGIAAQTADALNYAHRQGLVHRDIKPANVLLAESEWGIPRVKVTDFGIAKASEALGQDLTKTGMVLGTPKYLSPEQINGHEPDPRADLYALGVVLYEMLTGVPPFEEPTDVSMAMAHLHNRPVPVSQRRPGISPALDRLVLDLLAKDPKQRIPTASVLRQALARVGVSGQEPTTGTRPPQSSPSSAGRPGGPPASSRHGPPTPGRGMPPNSRGMPPGRPGGPNGPGSYPRGPQPAGSGMPPNSIAGGVGQYGPAPGPGVRPPPPPTYAAPGGSGGSGPSQGQPPNRPRPARRHLGVIVAVLALVALIVVGVLVAKAWGGSSSPSVSDPDPGIGKVLKIADVTVFMPNSRPPDNPGETPLTFDGNPATVWKSLIYGSPAFGNLYPGMGLAIHLASTSTLRTLQVVSPTVGWSAQTYVSANPVASGQSVTAWGAATASKSNVRGDATFDLGNRQGQYVLLWLTYLGPSLQIKIGELTVTS